MCFSQSGLPICELHGGVVGCAVPAVSCQVDLQVTISQPCQLPFIDLTLVPPLNDEVDYNSIYNYENNINPQQFNSMTASHTMKGGQSYCVYDDYTTPFYTDVFVANGSGNNIYSEREIKEKYMSRNPLFWMISPDAEYKYSIIIDRDYSLVKDNSFLFSTQRNTIQTILDFGINTYQAEGGTYTLYNSGGSSLTITNGFFANEENNILFPFVSMIIPDKNDPGDSSTVSSIICAIDEPNLSDFTYSYGIDCDDNGQLKVINSRYNPSLQVDNSVCQSLRGNTLQVQPNPTRIGITLQYTNILPATIYLPPAQGGTLLPYTPTAQAFTAKLYPVNNKCFIIIDTPITFNNILACNFYVNSDPILRVLTLQNSFNSYNGKIMSIGFPCESLSTQCNFGQSMTLNIQTRSNVTQYSYKKDLGTDPPITFWQLLALWWTEPMTYINIFWWFFIGLPVIFLIYWLIWWLITRCFLCGCCSNCCIPCRYCWYEDKMKLWNWEKEGFTKYQEREAKVSTDEDYQLFKMWKKNASVQMKDITTETVNVPITETFETTTTKRLINVEPNIVV